MASLPAQQPSQRRSSPSESAAPSSIANSESSSTSANPQEPQTSQTIFSRSSEEEEWEQLPEELRHQDENAERDIGTNAPPLDINDDPSIKRCWICFSVSTEDTPQTSPWRDPCPCALQAHEECLLDWIADMEAPNNPRMRAGGSPAKILCPQCKSEIKLARPKSLIVDAVTTLERVGAACAMPGSLLALSGLVYSGSLAWGIHSIYAVFGAEDGFRILRPWIVNSARAPVEVYVGSPSVASKQLFRVIVDHLQHWRLYVGLPLISPVLILSRTPYADAFLPMLPVVFFATQASSPTNSVEFGQWPPSASFTFAVLPYVRVLYNAYYEKFWAKKTQKWLMDIQPRAGHDQDDDQADEAEAPANPEPVAEEENIFEVRIDGGIFPGWGEENALEGQAQDNAHIPPAAPQQNDEDPAAPAPVVQDNRPEPQGENANPLAAAEAPAAQNAPREQRPAQQAAGANGRRAPGDRRMVISYMSVAETIVGALMFPTISGLMGEALKLILPTAWTTSPVGSSRFGNRFVQRGFLQQKWARSIVGGCLFVLCKDALMLYVRWKTAQMHGHRRVVDYDKRKSASQRSAR